MTFPSGILQVYHLKLPIGQIGYDGQNKNEDKYCRAFGSHIKHWFESLIFSKRYCVFSACPRVIQHLHSQVIKVTCVYECLPSSLFINMCT